MFQRQSRAEQSRAEQSRAEQSRAEQSRAEQCSSLSVCVSMYVYIRCISPLKNKKNNVMMMDAVWMIASKYMNK